jgi:hypothetical protein
MNSPLKKTNNTSPLRISRKTDSQANPKRKTILWVTLFGIAFGLVECAVVVYIRELYYPEGFDFPLKAISNRVIITELWREAATLIMLIGVGILAGRTRIERFAYFIMGFAVWDICYYMFLKAILNWPESFLTWDILFLLPVVWIGPVIAPIILSALMIILALAIIEKGKALNWKEWTLTISGAFVSILSFTKEYLIYLDQNTTEFSTAKQLASLSTTYVPTHYDWITFSLAVVLISTGIVHYWVRTTRTKEKLARMQWF